MFIHLPLFKRLVPASRSRRYALLILLVGVLILPATAAQAQVESKTEGKASIQRLGAVYEDGSGPFIASQAGDWRLANEHVALTFASVDTVGSTLSMPLAGYFKPIFPENRKPGALIDVRADGHSLDVLATFTQGIGLDSKALLVPYDMAEPVSADGKVGLRLEGSPFENAPIRMVTTYWLAEGSHEVQIETSLEDLPAGEPLPEIADIGQWGPSLVFVPREGVIEPRVSKTLIAPYYGLRNQHLSIVMAPEKGIAEGVFIGSGATTRVSALTRNVDDETTVTTSTATLPELSREQRTLRRSMFLAGNEMATAMNYYYKAHQIKTGTLKGEVTVPEENGSAAGLEVRIMRSPPPVIGLKPYQRIPWEVSFARTDAEGKFQVDLPEGYYLIRALNESIGSRIVSTASRVIAGEVAALKLQAQPRTGVRVHVVDAETQQPLAARLAFDSISPRIALNFGAPLAAHGYMNFAYVAPQPEPIYLTPGKWAVKVMHGLDYALEETAIDTEVGKIIDVTVALKRDNPTPGWQGVEIGARTTATPGVATTADDIALMAAAEGLDWIVSGDFQHITDLAPSLAKLNLSDRIQSSRGFRTLLPSHPEWGQFLVYPVAADAPDPAKASAQWNEAETAQAFIAKLRELYPGALIQADLPWTKEGLGYFCQYGVSPYATMYDPPEDRDLSIDAVTMISARTDATPKECSILYYNLAIKGHFLIPASSATGRCIWGAEPGYPRVMVFTGKDALAEVSEEELFTAMRALKTEVTNGPFLDYTIGGTRGMDILPYSEDLQLSARMTAPIWMEVSRTSFDKDGIPFIFLQNPQAVPDVQRYPWDPTTERDESSIVKMELLKSKDTLLGMAAEGLEGFNPNFPIYPRRPMTPFAFTAPIPIDYNLNGVFDPITLYSDKGR